MPTILDWRRSGKIGQRGYSSLAQSVEHLTVNQVVAGSSPAGGATKKPNAYALGFFERCVPQAEREASFGREAHFVREVCLSARDKEHIASQRTK